MDNQAAGGQDEGYQGGKVYARCPACGDDFQEQSSVLGSVLPCPDCGRWLKLERGPVLSGKGTFARASLSEPPEPPPPPERPAKKPRWLPQGLDVAAIWVAGAGAAVLIAVVLVALLWPTERRRTGQDGAPRSSEAPGSSEAPPSETSVPPPARLPQEEKAVSTQEVRPEPPVTPEVSEAQLATPAPETPEAEDLSAEDLFRRASPAVARVIVRDRNFTQTGMGSGFFVTADGVLVTNYHVVENAEIAHVMLQTEAILFVEGVLATDKASDLAVLKVKGKGLPHLHLASPTEMPAVGARVYALGNPEGLTNTLSEGLVSGIREMQPGTPVLQTNAAISPGSSGGPLMDTRGRVVGVATMTLGGPHAQNLNIAVAATKVHQALASAEEGTLSTLASSGGAPLVSDLGKDWLEVLEAMDEERWSDAVRIVQELRAKDPANPHVLFLLGLLHLRLGNHDLALESFREAVEVAPDEQIGHLGLGLAYQQLDRDVDAVVALRTATRLSPDLWPAHGLLAEILFTMGRHAESADACRAAIRLAPDEAMAYYYLGLNCLALGDRAGAIRAYVTLSKLDPELAADVRPRIPGF